MYRLKLEANKCRNIEYTVTTFLGCGKKNLKEATLEVHLPSGRHNVMPFLIDESFCVETRVNGLSKAVKNLEKLGYKLAANFDSNSDMLPVEGIVGTDILQFLRELKTVSFMSGVAYEVSSGLIPFGHTSHFLHIDY